MYYTATDLQAATNNRIGLAYSNNGINWVKYSNPLIYPQAYPTSLYGAGQAASYNGDGRAGIRLFHTDDTTASGTRMWTRTTRDGVHFSAPVLLSNSGATLNANSDFAYDYQSGYFYAAIGGGGRAGDRETYHFSFARMPAGQLLNGTGTWETLGEVSTNLTGYYLNHSPGLRRDLYGNLTTWLPNVEAYFAQGTNDPNTWDLTWAEWHPSPNTLAFKRYYNGGIGDHWVTTGYKSSGYNLESTLGYLFQAPQAGTHPLYGCQIGSDHFISLDPNAEGQRMLGINGWIYDSPGAGRQALYRARTASGDHFVTPDPNGEGQIVENNGQPLGYAKTTP